MQGYTLPVLLPACVFFAVTLLSSAVMAGSIVTHNGRPFFPIGVYHLPEGLPYEPRLEELANAGFNTILSGLTSSTEFMDEAHAHGIGVIAVLGWNMVLDKDGEQSKKTLRENIERLKDHPALLGYEAPDEIAWVDYDQPNRKPGESVDELLRGYAYIKSLDPDSPVWMNHAPRNKVEYLRSYSEAGDILGTDIYPVPAGGIGHSDLDPSLNCVGQYTEKLDEVGQGKPIYMVLQGFGWENLPGREDQDLRQPNWGETRFMAYDAVCHGANGVIYWGMYYTKLEDPIWGHLKRIASELRDLTPVFTSGPFEALQSPNRDMEIHLRRHEGYNYLFVLNTGTSRLPNREIPLPASWAGGTATVLFEDRSLAVTGSRLIDSFDPLGVHVYTDDPRVDVDVEAESPRLLELGKEASLKVEIHNRGASNASPFNVTLRAADRVISRVTLGGLEAFTSTTLNITWTPFEEGEASLRLDLDPDGNLDERSLRNNAEFLRLVVSKAGPDLVVRSVNMTGQDAVCTELANVGMLVSPPFNVSLAVGPHVLPDARVMGLGVGESATVCWELDDQWSGELQASIRVDEDGEVDEMLEDNNRHVETLYLEDLVRDGPVLHVRGLAHDRLWLIKYNGSIGAIGPDSDACTLVWGMDGWRYPDSQPKGSLRVDGRCESPMKIGLDGLWYIVIPSQLGDSLHFRFRDHQGNGTLWDDNDGRDWRVVRTGWVLELLTEYERVVDLGISLGVEMEEFSVELSDARALYGLGDLLSALELAEGYMSAGVAYVTRLRELALEEVNSAEAMGIPVETYERNLWVAGEILKAGKYETAENYCEKVIADISDEKAKIPELPFALLIPLLAISVALLRVIIGGQIRARPGPGPPT